MRLEQGPGPGFVLLATALTLGVAWSAAQTKAPTPEGPVRLTSTPVLDEDGPGAGFQVVQDVRPDGRAYLQTTDHGAEALPLPGLSELSGEALIFAVDTLNGTAATCAPCWEAGRSMADCLLDTPDDCGVMAPAAQRVVALAKEGLTPPQIQDRVSFEDAWYPTPTLALPGDALADAALPVWVAVDYASPFSREAQAAWDALRGRYAEELAIAWVLAPRDEPAAQAAARAALVAQERGCFEAVHAALLAEEAATFQGELPPTAALERAFTQAGCGEAPGAQEGAEALRAHQALADALGVRGTPTAYVLGHRVRGLRDVEDYARVLRAEQGDAP